MFIFHFSMVFGFGGVPFLYSSEVAPLSLRTTINMFVDWELSAATRAMEIVLAVALDNNRNRRPNPSIFMFIFHFSMVFGFGGVPFLYSSEVAPLSLRTTIIIAKFRQAKMRKYFHPMALKAIGVISATRTLRAQVFGFGGVPFLYSSEVAPLSLRTTINGIGSSIYWALSVLKPKTMLK
jgi:hypothetical protein